MVVEGADIGCVVVDVVVHVVVDGVVAGTVSGCVDDGLTRVVVGGVFWQHGARNGLRRCLTCPS